MKTLVLWVFKNICIFWRFSYLWIDFSFLDIFGSGYTIERAHTHTHTHTHTNKSRPWSKPKIVATTITTITAASLTVARSCPKKSPSPWSNCTCPRTRSAKYTISTSWSWTQARRLPLRRFLRRPLTPCTRRIRPASRTTTATGPPNGPTWRSQPFVIKRTGSSRALTRSPLRFRTLSQA